MRPIRHAPHDLNITPPWLRARVRITIFLPIPIKVSVPALLIPMSDFAPAMQMGMTCESVILRFEDDGPTYEQRPHWVRFLRREEGRAMGCSLRNKHDQYKLVGRLI
jgi:hypothetical protein